MKPLAFHRYLEDERAIPGTLLKSGRFAGKLKVDYRANAIFPHADQDGPCGYEIKPALIRAALLKLGQGSRVMIATDNDEGGRGLADLIEANGLASAEIHQKRAVLTLPGYFRPTKLWDLLVINRNHLIAAIELKSQVGTVLTEGSTSGAFGKCPRPFVSWMMMVEDAPESRRPVTDRSPHFPIFKEFQGASYLKRYDILCQRLVQEQLDTTASVVASPRSAAATGEFSSLSDLKSLKTFVTSFAGHVAAEAART